MAFVYIFIFMEDGIFLNHSVKGNGSQRRLDGVMVVGHHVQDLLPRIRKTRLDPVAEQDPVRVRLDGSLSVREGQGCLNNEDDRPHSTVSLFPVARNLHQHFDARVRVTNSRWLQKKVQSRLAVANLGLRVAIGRLRRHSSQAVGPLGVGPKLQTLFSMPGMNSGQASSPMLSSGIAPTTVRFPLVMIAVDLRRQQKCVRRKVESLEDNLTVVHVLSNGSHVDDDDDDDYVTKLVLKHKLDNAKSV